MYNNWLTTHINKNLFKILPLKQIFNNNKETIIIIPKNFFFFFFKFIKYHQYYQMNYLSYINIIDYPQKKNRFEIIYSFLNLYYCKRIKIKFYLLSTTQKIPSLTTLFPVANWLEREMWEMFGIIFKDHPNLKRLLTDYGFNFFPLQKTYPLIGYYEIFFHAQQKKLQYKPILSNYQPNFLQFTNSSWMN